VRIHIHINEKKTREGKDIDGDDLVEKINIVPQLLLPSADGAQKSLLLFFLLLSIRYVLCT
jgi:hypothetical protein